MAAISWLHLSDWHQKGEDFDRKVVRDALIKDIRERASRMASSLEKINFIVFSGDLAFSGQEAEFKAAQKYLLEPLLDATGIETDKLFFVPGNHDINQNIIYEMLPTELQKPLDSDSLIQKWLLDTKKRERILEPFEAYRNFVNGYTGQLTPDYSTSLRITVEDSQVALVGINSSWMCARNKDVDGRVNDYGYTLVGEPQIYDALGLIPNADLYIGVIHHPFDWLAEFDRNRVEAHLMKGCQFILSGHQHKQKVTVVNSTSGNCVIIPAGASYNRRLSDDPRYVNAYNFTHLDLKTGAGTVFLRRWSDQRNEWLEDIDSYPNGKFPIKVLPKNLVKKKARHSKPTQPASKLDVESNERLQAAERRYRELLLETCDIINLANLPEQDRHIAQRQQDLRLRSLFIPLRVRVEKISNEDSTVVEEEKHWEELEKRRNKITHSGAQVRKESDELRITVGERLATAKRLVILGDPGAGKTTLTRWIATAYLLRLKRDDGWKELPDVKTLPDTDLLPIIIRCRELDVDSLRGSLEDILKHTLRKAELSEKESQDLRTLLKERLKNGHALLMLDGLDEITDSTVRAEFCQQLEKIVLAYPDAPIIATSRIVGYREMGYKLSRGFEHLTLVDLIPTEKDDFARRWCMLTEVPERREIAMKELIHDIHSAERIERLTGNPMLLTTMALVKRKVGKLPNRRADLYWEAVQVLLNWRREVDEPLDTREAIPQLEYAAYVMCDRGVQQLRQDEILELFVAMRDEYPNIHAARNRSPEEFLKRLEARTGILVEAGHMRHLGMLVPVYEFRHLTFQEYLAARALVDGRFPNRNSGRSLAAYVAPLAGRTTKTDLIGPDHKETLVVENWREALLLCASICKDDDVDAMLLAVLVPEENDESDVARARSILAALCLADEPNTSTATAEKIIKSLVGYIGKEDGGGPRRTSLDEAIAELANTRWIGVVRKYLLDAYVRCESDVRNGPGGLIAGVEIELAPQDEEQLDKRLIELTQKLSSSDERDAIEAALFIMALAFRRKVKIIPGLIDSLLRLLSDNKLTSYAASWALAWLNGGSYKRLSDKTEGFWHPNPNEIELLINYLHNRNSDAYAVRFLTWILGTENLESAVEPLLFWLDSSKTDVQDAVVTALSNIKSEASIPPLIARLKSVDQNMRRAAVTILGNIGYESVVAPLILLLEDADKDVRIAVVKALGNIGHESAAEPLIPLLEDADKDVRSAIVKALGNIGHESAVASLIPLLEDADKDVRIAVVKALGNIGHESVVAPLIPLLEDADKDVRSAIVEVLGNIRHESAVAPLIPLLEDADKDVRSAIVEVLGNIGHESAVAPLIPLLEDADKDVRIAVVKALGNIGHESAAEPLIPLLEDADKDVRSAIVKALGNIGHESAVAPLIPLLEDADEDVRRTVIEALGNIGHESVVASLIPLLEDADEDVRRTVIEALGNIGHESVVASLIPLLEDADEDVRRTVVEALGNIGHESVVAPLIPLLEDADEDVRRTVVEALVKSRKLDETNRTLLSRDLDGLEPFWDPQELITEDFARKMSKTLDLTEPDTQSRYENLARQFKLRLEWKQQ